MKMENFFKPKTKDLNIDKETQQKIDSLKWQIKTVQEGIDKERKMGTSEKHLLDLEEDIKKWKEELTKLEKSENSDLNMFSN